MKSISAKLITLLVIITLVPLSLYGILSIRTANRFHLNAMREGNINIAKRAAEEIDIYFANSLSILNTMAQNLGRFNMSKEEMNLILGNYMLNFNEFQHIYITDREGKEIISDDNKLLENRNYNIAHRTAINGEIYKSDVFISKNLTPYMTIAIPLKRLNMVEGAAIADINLIAMWDLVDSIKIGKGGYAFLVCGNGDLIAHGLGAGKVRVLSNESVKSLKIVKSVLQGKYTTDIYRNIEGEDVIGVAAPIPSLGWGIVIAQPLNEAYAPIRRMAFLLTTIIVLFAITASVIGYLGGRRYIISPIQALIGTTRKVAKGNLDDEVIITTGDEFEEMGNAFNMMMDNLKKLQEDIKRNERITFLGKIAANLVHDLRHPIRNIENSSKLIISRCGQQIYKETYNNIVQREFSNINRFLDDLLNLIRPVHLTLSPLNICAEMTETIEGFKEETENIGIRVETIFPEQGLKISVDKFSIERVFKNIIRNAIEAMPAGGALKISVISSHDSVVTEFRDTGNGIPKDKIKGLFTEFTTTKGGGLGLGLAISKKIIEAHNGTITIESEVGKGTTVCIKLPKLT